MSKICLRNFQPSAHNYGIPNDVSDDDANGTDAAETSTRGVTTALQTSQCAGPEGSRGPVAAGKKRNCSTRPVGATATKSRRRGRPVIDGGSRGAVGVAT